MAASRRAGSRVSAMVQTTASALAAHDGGDGHAHVGDAVPLLQQRGDGQYALLVVEDGGDDALHSQTHSVVGNALTLDDAVGAAHYVVSDAVALLLVEVTTVKGGAPLG